MKTQLRLSWLTLIRLAGGTSTRDMNVKYTLFGYPVTIDVSMGMDEIKVEYVEETFEELWEKSGKAMMVLPGGTQHKVIIS